METIQERDLYELIRAYSSDGRASDYETRCHGFESPLRYFGAVEN